MTEPACPNCGKDPWPNMPGEPCDDCAALPCPECGAEAGSEQFETVCFPTAAPSGKERE